MSAFDIEDGAAGPYDGACFPALIEATSERHEMVCEEHVVTLAHVAIDISCHTD